MSRLFKLFLEPVKITYRPYIAIYYYTVFAFVETDRNYKIRELARETRLRLRLCFTS